MRRHADGSVATRLRGAVQQGHRVGAAGHGEHEARIVRDLERARRRVDGRARSLEGWVVAEGGFEPPAKGL